jgi:hypothetical protein
MKMRGPVVTLAAAAAVGTAMWLVNVSQQPDTPTATQVTQSVPTTPPAPATTPPAPVPTPPAFPPKGDYVGKIPTRAGVITLEITVTGDRAVAYACDGNSVEVWLSGRAADGVVTLVNKNRTSRLEGRLKGDAVVGTLSIGQERWDFTSAVVQPPAGLYVYQDDGVRSSWIIDDDQTVTGVQRRADGSTAAAPRLSADGTAVVDGRTVVAVRVEGDSDVR